MVNWYQAITDLLQAIVGGVVVALVIFWLDERRAIRERRLSDYRIASNWYTTEPKVSLRNFDLTKANLSGQKFVRANLERAIIREGGLWGANFSEANLREVNFRKSIIVAGRFRKASAFSADFSGARIQETKDHRLQPDFSYAILKDAKFIGAHLTAVLMVEANLKNADFTKARVQDCDFTGADLTGSNWKKVRPVENCIWKNVKVDNEQNFPKYLWEEIQEQNAKPSRKTKPKK